MSRLLKKRFAVALLALFALGFVFESQADARRYRRGVYRVAPVGVYVGPAVAVRAPYVGVRVNRFGGVAVRAPFVGVRVW